MEESLNIKSVHEKGTVTFGSIEHRTFLTDSLIFLKMEVSVKEEEIKTLKEKIAFYNSVTDIDAKKQNQKRIENQINIAELAEAEVVLIDVTSKLDALEKELDKLMLGPSEEVGVSRENELNGWLDLQIQIVENEMLRDELNGENNVATENDSVIELKQQAAETEPSNLDSKLDALTELVFTLRSENIKSEEARDTYFEAAKKLLEKWQKEEEKV